jgi:hypothetical protein
LRWTFWNTSRILEDVCWTKSALHGALAGSPAAGPCEMVARTAESTRWRCSRRPVAAAPSRQPSYFFEEPGCPVGSAEAGLGDAGALGGVALTGPVC